MQELFSFKGMLNIDDATARLLLSKSAIINSEDPLALTVVLDGFKSMYERRASTFNGWFAQELTAFEKTPLYQSIRDVAEYVIYNTYDLTNCGFEVMDNGLPKVPLRLHSDITNLYFFWWHCVSHPYLTRGLSFRERIASLYILKAFHQLRIDFGLHSDLLTPSIKDCSFTYGELGYVSDTDFGTLRNTSSRLQIDSKPAISGDQFFDTCTELDGFHRGQQDSSAAIPHSEACRLVSVCRGYQPTKFSYLDNGVELIPDLHNHKRICQIITKKLETLRINKRNQKFSALLDFSDENFVVAHIAKGTAKLPLPMVLKADKALFSLLHNNEPWKPFQFITCNA